MTLSNEQFQHIDKFTRTAKRLGLNCLDGAYGQCGVASAHFHKRAGGDVLEFVNPKDTRHADSAYRHTLNEDISHRVNLVGGHIVDWTGVQLNENEKNFPIVEPLEQYKKRFAEEPRVITSEIAPYKPGDYSRNRRDLADDDWMTW